MKGHYEREQFVQQQEWERTRWQTCLLLNIQMSSGSRITPQELIEFEWEKKEKQKRSKDIPSITKEELERIKKLYK